MEAERQMLGLLTWLLSTWARSDHPLLHYELSAYRQVGSQRNFAWQFVLLSSLLVGAAYIIGASRGVAGGSITNILWHSLYYPLLLLQMLLLIVVLALSADTVKGARRRRTWDSLRVTELGAGLALRARCIGVLYRLRAPLLVLLLVRVLLVLGMLLDLSAFGGLYADMLGAEALPTLEDSRVVILLIATNMTVSLLLPLFMLAAVSAFGILLSAAIKERIYVAAIQLLFLLFLLAFVVSGAISTALIMEGSLSLADEAELALFLSYSFLGDWGLMLAQLEKLGEVWSRVAYSAYIPGIMGMMLLLLGLAADGMMRLAVRLSDRQG